MKPLRGKAIALWSAGAAVVVMIAGGLALRQRILEEWFIFKLGSDEWEVSYHAAKRLGRMESVRAVPYLLETYRSGRFQARHSIHYCGKAIADIGGGAVPLLMARTI